ncbi:hypothetical protein CVD25_01730 [Bacillus canaveralius]|uniref:YheE family protein n=1 Tax=Bacillus canaveralius TaxID=1403243 RepID=A0A2N5GJA5_9BACI|nr:MULTISPECIES: YheE family protein [Bacillus]PLR81187.1 hypothetical protein CU635_15620 [Bacillus canaveralius]PLR86646.1 hypothetical protein CVD23_05770 [Bacillus sp. V33-4]PLS00634.1 hypothetical protein CVD25_01730 [Bacillus canaveralius]RSK51550.1 hypothetical protein EJA13_14230 [Bacillus canaveralius]
MLTHFQYKPLYANNQLPGWTFSFYLQKKKYEGIYHQSGKIEWTSIEPNQEIIADVQSQIHELMLYHVYEK